MWALVLVSGTTWAQYADPAVTGANFTPNLVEVGQSSVLTISFANSGSTPIPSGSIELTISTPSAYYRSNGATAPAGTGGALFTWTYLGVDTWRGTNSGSIPAFGGGIITLSVTGTAVTSGVQTTNVNVQPVTSFAAFTDSPSNNNLQIKMGVTAANSLSLASMAVSQTATVGQPKSGSAVVDVVPSGGTAPYVYSNGATDVACVAPVGATALPSTANLVVNSNGTYSYTAPTTAGTYYYCIKVCDSSTPTPSCKVATYTVTVQPTTCNAGNVAPILVRN